MASTEKQFVDWLIHKHIEPRLPITIGPRDDCGVFDQRGPVVVATDLIADGVHFRSEEHSLLEIGHKAIAVNLSDVAAMGAWPFAATVSFCCPRHFKLVDLQSLFTGIETTAIKYGVQILGGDTNFWDGKLVVGVSVFGTAIEGALTDFWTMNSARPGDQIVVSGSLGGSILGKHLSFEPRLELARYLMTHYVIHAATDITDSLALDLASIARQSRCGFALRADKIPIAAAARELSKARGHSSLEHALYDGEDFELVFCVPVDLSEPLLRDPAIGKSLSWIGCVTDLCEFTIQGDESTPTRELQIRGYEH